MSNASVDRKAYSNRSLGRPLSVESSIMFAQEMADVPSLTTNWETGLIYVQGDVVAKAKSYGFLGPRLPRLTPDELIDSCLYDLEKAAVLEERAQQPVEVRAKRIATRPNGNFCRVVVEVFDVPCSDYQPIPGQLLGEKIQAAKELAPQQVPRPRNRLNNIWHGITLATAHIDDLARLREAADALNSKVKHGDLPNLELHGLAAVQTNVRVGEQIATQTTN